MKTKFLFLVSLLVLVSTASAVDFHSPDSGVKITNDYPQLSMKVTLQNAEWTANMWNGYGRNPLTGAAPKIIYREVATYSVPAGEKYFFAASPGIVLTRGFLIVTTTWFDAKGKQQGQSASTVFYPGGSDRAWTICYTPFPGQYSGW